MTRLSTKRCVPCEGGVPKLTSDQVAELIREVPQWSVSEDAKSIVRKVNAKTFVKAVGMIQAIAEVAEAEAHHPDLHLTGYRNLKIEITTHAIGGLSENDFILAAKIDALLQ